jgi:mRNA interferase RelE/StbE
LTKWRGNLAWTIRIADTALEDMNSLAKSDRERVLKFIYQRLQNHPDPRRLAEPLFGSFAGFGRFRVGDFRLICKFIETVLVVTVVRVKHRREVYR